MRSSWCVWGGLCSLWCTRSLASYPHYTVLQEMLAADPRATPYLLPTTDTFNVMLTRAVRREDAGAGRGELEVRRLLGLMRSRLLQPNAVTLSILGSLRTRMRTHAVSAGHGVMSASAAAAALADVDASLERLCSSSSQSMLRDGSQKNGAFNQVCASECAYLMQSLP